MNTGKLCRDVLLLACLAVATLARGAAPAPAAEETLDEVGVQGARERQRKRDPGRNGAPQAYQISVFRDATTGFSLTLAGIRTPEVYFRSESIARQLMTEFPSSPQQTEQMGSQPQRVTGTTLIKEIPALIAARAAIQDQVRLSGERLFVVDENSLSTALLTLADDVDEPDGLPASIPFGPHAALVNLDHVRLLDTRHETNITVRHAIHPQTRRCERAFTLIDDQRDSRNRLILLNDSQEECRRAEQGRNGDLLFADNVPEKLRQAVQEVYEPIAARLAIRLGSEPGLVFVASWPDSPHEGFRFERSWNRSNLLLFNGSEWQQGLDGRNRLALRTLFITEQIQRRFRQTDWPGPFTESAASYLQAMFTAEQAGETRRWLTDELPGWIAGCASYWNEPRTRKVSGSDVASLECGLVVQFVYDAVARAKSTGRSSIYDTWHRLLAASYQRGKSGAKPADFLASSAEARRIVQGLLDGGVDWRRFTAEMAGAGVHLGMDKGAPDALVQVLSLDNFRD